MIKHIKSRIHDLFQDLSRRVDDIMNDAQRSEDEGCITEDFSDSRGSSETKVTVEDVKCTVVRCQEPSCQASKKFETILKVFFYECFFIKFIRFLFSVFGRH